jgi:hypothetical protein
MKCTVYRNTRDAIVSQPQSRAAPARRALPQPLPPRPLFLLDCEKTETITNVFWRIARTIVWCGIELSLAFWEPCEDRKIVGKVAMKRLIAKSQTKKLRGNHLGPCPPPRPISRAKLSRHAVGGTFACRRHGSANQRALGTRGTLFS